MALHSLHTAGLLQRVLSLVPAAHRHDVCAWTAAAWHHSCALLALISRAQSTQQTQQTPPLRMSAGVAARVQVCWTHKQLEQGQG